MNFHKIEKQFNSIANNLLGQNTGSSNIHYSPVNQPQYVAVAVQQPVYYPQQQQPIMQQPQPIYQQQQYNQQPIMQQPQMPMMQPQQQPVGGMRPSFTNQVYPQQQSMGDHSSTMLPQQQQNPINPQYQGSQFGNMNTSQPYQQQQFQQSPSYSNSPQHYPQQQQQNQNLGSQFQLNSSQNQNMMGQQQQQFQQQSQPGNIQPQQQQTQQQSPGQNAVGGDFQMTSSLYGVQNEPQIQEQKKQNENKKLDENQKEEKNQLLQQGNEEVKQQSTSEIKKSIQSKSLSVTKSQREIPSNLNGYALSSTFKCPKCSEVSKSNVVLKNGRGAYFCCCLLFPTMLCFLPFCLDNFKDKVHFCKCGEKVGSLPYSLL